MVSHPSRFSKKCFQNAILSFRWNRRATTVSLFLLILGWSNLVSGQSIDSIFGFIIDDSTDQVVGDYLECYGTRDKEQGRIGIWVHYRPDGSIQKKVSHKKNGKRDRIIAFFNHDQVSIRFDVIRDTAFSGFERMHGKVLVYDSLGHLRSKLHYVDDVRTGRVRYYSSSGKLLAKGVYLNGNKTGRWKYFDSDGQRVSAEPAKFKELEMAVLKRLKNLFYFNPENLAWDY